MHIACIRISAMRQPHYASEVLRFYAQSMRVSKCGMPVEGYRILLLTQR